MVCVYLQTSALASPTAALRAGLPFGSGSPGGGLPSGLGSLGAPPMGPGEAYASPTRTQSHSGIYSNVAHQVDTNRQYTCWLVTASSGLACCWSLMVAGSGYGLVTPGCAAGLHRECPAEPDVLVRLSSIQEKPAVGSAPFR